MRMRSLSRLPVVIRFEGEGNPKSSNWHLSDLIAIFPTLEGRGGDAYSMECYSSTGQHSHCEEGYIRKTKKPTKEQIAAMLRELGRVGYAVKDLNVTSRVSPRHHERRRARVRTEYRIG